MGCGPFSTKASTVLGKLGWVVSLPVTQLLPPETIKKWDNIDVEQFFRHWISGNEGQCSLRGRKQMRGVLPLSRLMPEENLHEAVQSGNTRRAWCSP